MQNNFYFDPDFHAYTYKGVIIPSVTQIISESGLFPQFGSQQHMDKGSRIHQVCEAFDNVTDSDIDDDISGYLSAYMDFRESCSWEVEQIEERYFHPILQYAGTIDRVFRDDKKLYLVDIKSGSKHPSHPIQLEGYVELLKANKIKINKCFCLYLMDKKYKLDEVKLPGEFFTLLNYRRLQEKYGK